MKATLNRAILLSFFLLTIQQGFAQLKTYQFEELDSLQKKEARPVAIFIHTDWCKYCAAMQNTTLQEKEVISKLNEGFYFIEFNAEEKRNINMLGRTFKYKPTGNNTGIHELAEQLARTKENVSYPTLCFLNSDFEITFQHSQFINAADLLTVLNKLK
jgi:thioredoxin-related protein